jgi:hypothetical protein
VPGFDEGEVVDNKGRVRRSFLQGCLAFGTLAVLEPAAWAASWQKLGTRTVLLVNDTDVIPVTFLNGAFSRVQVRVKGNGIYMYDLRVRFSNGELVSLPIRARINAGGQSRAIPLPGGRRYISYLALDYRSVANSKGRATVEVWGWRVRSF